MNRILISTLQLQGNVCPEVALLQHEFRAMGVEMMAALQSDAPMAWLSVRQVPKWFEEWEQIISHYRADSELSMLNRSDGAAVAVSPELWEALGVALRAAEETEGAVTPASREAQEAFAANDAEKSGLPLWRQIELEPGAQTVRLPRGVRIDFEGTAKGLVADRAVTALGTAGPALVDAGGKIAVSGSMLDGSPWPIAVANPFDPSKELAVLRVSKGGVATSARPATQSDSLPGGHETSDILSVTVMGPSTVAAEVAARAVLGFGSRKGIEWLQARRDLAGLLVLQDGAIMQTPNFAQFVWSLQPGLA